MIEIVCYMGGTCGDLIAALIDPTDTRFKVSTRTVAHDEKRIKLKKPHLFVNDTDKDQYISDISQFYRSIPSHDIEYHSIRQHSFIGITVNNTKTAQWAAERFKQAHRPHVWEEMQKVCGAESIKDYAQMLIDYSSLIKNKTDRILTLESIQNGTIINDLEKIINRPIDKIGCNMYNSWIDLQKGRWLI